jgi:uncharacterized membrane protein YdbT with pleckstrin-like domain
LNLLTKKIYNQLDNIQIAMRSFTIKPSQKKHIFKYTFLGITIFVLAILPFWVNIYKEIAFYISSALIILIFLNIIYTYLYTKLHVITIRETGVQFSYGVFHRTTETIELHRILDFVKFQDFDDLIFKLAAVTIHSTDKTTPEKIFRGLHVHDAKRMIDFLQLYSSDSLVKHLNQLDDAPNGKAKYDYAIKKTNQKQQSIREL